jgi:FKBP-type peptidyl-prolyl cis-trans isomerase
MRKQILLALTIVAAVGLFSLAASGQTRSRKSSVRRAAVVKPKVVVLSAGAVKTVSGLTYLVTKRGTGAMPKTGDTVVVNYTGTFTSGKRFDSSHDRGTPIEFPLGQGNVIKGWDEGIAKLRVGDQAIFVIPSSIAYGPRGRGSIPPDTTLIFIVELVGIKPAATTP